MANLAIFKSRLARIVYIFKDGEKAVFAPRGSSAHGWYMTKDPKKIAELQEVHNQAHTHIYIDPEESEIDESLADPVIAMREEMAAAERQQIINLLGDPNQMQGLGLDMKQVEALKDLIGKRDMGNYSGQSFQESINNSTTAAATSAESNAGMKVPAIQVPVKKVQ